MAKKIVFIQSYFFLVKEQNWFAISFSKMDWEGFARTAKVSNPETEIETLEEFILKTQANTAPTLSLKGWNFTQIDFTKPNKINNEVLTPDKWNKFDLNGAEFYGCIFPTFTTPEQVRQAGALVRMNPPDNEFPFVPYRAFMYTQTELQQNDEKIYAFYQDHCPDVRTIGIQAVHDYFIQDALLDYLEHKTAVVIMGGHGLSRKSPAYAAVVHLGWKLARLGFVVATGGGPGAMEAANLGAYLFEQDESQVADAIQLISTIVASTRADGTEIQHEYQNTAAAQAVITKFGLPQYAPSLGIPTWKYGHEPPNMFATWQAKMFSNALREDGLVAIGNGGIIYFPGSAGTRQEVFQAACRNHYAKPKTETPMIFYDKKFWDRSGIVDVLAKNSSGKAFADLLLLTDSIDAIVNHVVRFREERHLPIVTVDEMKSNYWEQSSSLSCKQESGERSKKKMRTADTHTRRDRRRTYSDKCKFSHALCCEKCPQLE